MAAQYVWPDELCSGSAATGIGILVVGLGSSPSQTANFWSGLAHRQSAGLRIYRL